MLELRAIEADPRGLKALQNVLEGAQIRLGGYYDGSEMIGFARVS